MSLYVNEHPQIACSIDVNRDVFDALIDHQGRTNQDRAGWERRNRELVAVCKSICAGCPALEACMLVEAPRVFTERTDRGVVAGVTDKERATQAGVA